MAAEETPMELPLTRVVAVVEAMAAALLGVSGVMVTTKVLLPLTKADLLTTERLNTAVDMTTTLPLTAAELPVTVVDMVEAVATRTRGRVFSL